MRLYPKLPVLAIMLLLVLSYASHSCTERHPEELGDGLSVSSPDGALTLSFQLKEGVPFYHLKQGNRPLINASRLGLKLFEASSLDQNFHLLETKLSTFDSIQSNQEGDGSFEYKQLSVSLRENSGDKRKLNLVFRVFNEGVSFKYVIPQQKNIERLKVRDEYTEFSVAHNFDVGWLSFYPANPDRAQEFRKNKVNDLSEAVQTPLTMAYGDSLFVSIHESGAPAYPRLAIVNNGNNTLKGNLIGGQQQQGGQASLESPWRTVQVSRRAEDLVNSKLSPPEGQVRKAIDFLLEGQLRQ